MYFEEDAISSTGLSGANCPFCKAGPGSVNFTGNRAYCTSCRTEFSFYPQNYSQYFKSDNLAVDMWKRLNR